MFEQWRSFDALLEKGEGEKKKIWKKKERKEKRMKRNKKGTQVEGRMKG